jgi:dihydroorotase/N-acyl-D-amino-acid deacylase
MGKVGVSVVAGSVLLAAVTVRSQTPPAYDLVIAGGRIVDGTGAPWFRGDIGIKGDRIAAVGDLSQAAAARRIDARDHMVAPGFIDMLGQSEMTLLADNRAESKIHQGIISEITGEGVSTAPATEATLKDQRAWLDTYKIKVDWTDFRGYFDALRRARPALNLGSFVGAAQVRQVVLGSEDAQPTAEQLRQMEGLVETAMQQGALGLSTSLIYPPGSYARTPELVALARVPARHGGVYASHIRDEGSHEMEALEEAITIGREAKIPVEIWHLKVAGRLNWGHMKDVVARIERARAEGLDVTADMYPRGQRQRPRRHRTAMGAGGRSGRDDPALPRSRCARILKEIREATAANGTAGRAPAGGHPHRKSCSTRRSRSGRGSASRRSRRRWGSRPRRRSSTSWRRTARTSSWPASP